MSINAIDKGCQVVKLFLNVFDLVKAAEKYHQEKQVNSPNKTGFEEVCYRTGLLFCSILESSAVITEASTNSRQKIKTVESLMRMFWGTKIVAQKISSESHSTAEACEMGAQHFVSTMRSWVEARGGEELNQHYGGRLGAIDMLFRMKIMSRYCHQLYPDSVVENQLEQAIHQHENGIRRLIIDNLGLRMVMPELMEENRQLRVDIQKMTQEMMDLEDFDLLALPFIPEGLHQDKIFSQCICPITKAPVRDPIKDPNGKTIYEKSAILEWIRKKGESPITRKSLTINQLIQVPHLKSLIDERLRFYKRKIQHEIHQQLQAPASGRYLQAARGENPNLNL